MTKHQHFKYLLPLVMAILAISLISVTGCTKQDPFIPAFIPPPDEYYIEITPMQIAELMASDYSDPYVVKKQWEGESFLIKNISVDEPALSTKQEDHIYFNYLKCIPQKPADLLKLKEGDVIDIIGVLVDNPPTTTRDHIGIFILVNCQFLPTGLYPLPLPGSGRAPIPGY